MQLSFELLNSKTALHQQNKNKKLPTLLSH